MPLIAPPCEAAGYPSSASACARGPCPHLVHRENPRADIGDVDLRRVLRVLLACVLPDESRSGEAKSLRIIRFMNSVT